MIMKTLNAAAMSINANHFSVCAAFSSQTHATNVATTNKKAAIVAAVTAAWQLDATRVTVAQTDVRIKQEYMTVFILFFRAEANRQDEFV